jgi:hypothetical protein
LFIFQSPETRYSFCRRIRQQVKGKDEIEGNLSKTTWMMMVSEKQYKY